tara:strand:+ start:33 stop:308 length:276 start_codon:yes stop_codon:yes gene_type:complete
MNKSKLAKRVAKKLDRHNNEVLSIVNQFITELSNEIQAGNVVNLSGFGSFQVRTRAARKGRNPNTGESIKLPETRSVGFSASEKLKERLQG